MFSELRNTEEGHCVADAQISKMALEVGMGNDEKCHNCLLLLEG